MEALKVEVAGKDAVEWLRGSLYEAIWCNCAKFGHKEGFVNAKIISTRRL